MGLFDKRGRHQLWYLLNFAMWHRHSIEGKEAVAA
jgi:hypothetical protein